MLEPSLSNHLRPKVRPHTHLAFRETHAAGGALARPPDPIPAELARLLQRDAQGKTGSYQLFVIAAEETATMRAKLFISYALADAPYFEQLRKQLLILAARRLTHSGDAASRAGRTISAIVSAQIDEADIIIQLVSPDYFQTDLSAERNHISAKRSERSDVRILPVLLRPTAVTPDLEAIAFLNHKAVVSMPNLDQAWADIVVKVVEVAESLPERGPSFSDLAHDYDRMIERTTPENSDATHLPVSLPGRPTSIADQPPPNGLHALPVSARRILAIFTIATLGSLLTTIWLATHRSPSQFDCPQVPSCSGCAAPVLVPTDAKVPRQERKCTISDQRIICPDVAQGTLGELKLSGLVNLGDVQQETYKQPGERRIEVSLRAGADTTNICKASNTGSCKVNKSIRVGYEEGRLIIFHKCGFYSPQGEKYQGTCYLNSLQLTFKPVDPEH